MVFCFYYFYTIDLVILTFSVRLSCTEVRLSNCICLCASSNSTPIFTAVSVFFRLLVVWTLTFINKC